MKETTAQSYLEILCHCPYCDFVNDVLEDVREVLPWGELSADKLEVEKKCEECNQTFIITDVFY